MENDNVQYINGYEVVYLGDGEIIAYKDNKFAYRIRSDGITEILSRSGSTLKFEGLTPDDIKPGAILIREDGGRCNFDGDVITRIVFDDGEVGEFGEIIYTDTGQIYREYDKEGGEIVQEITTNNDGSSYSPNFETGNIEYNDTKGKCYRIEHPDGTNEYVVQYEVKDEHGTSNYINKTTLTTYPDGTYVSGDEKGTYTVDKDGNIICKDSQGNQVFYNKYGKVYQSMDKNGIVFNSFSDTQITTNNGKTMYSKYNHIEYDEESYNKILNTLNGFEGSNIDGECDKIVDIVNGFPDSCSTSGIEDVKNDVKNHVNLIKSLSEMTNYSLLAYQTCDEELREGLYLLVDSLFSENEKELGERFKNAIKNTIEDRDNDKILEYKEGTNFKILSKNAIVSSIYTDEDGNKWYLNKNNRVIGIEGKDIKLKYGGETFNLTYDENGVVKLTDSNGKPLNIFGDYNLESKQYGGNQGDLQYAYNDQYVYDIVSGYFPNANMEEITDLITKSVNKSCGNVTMTNFIFKLSEGKEEEFYNTFGYPMYDIKYDSKLGLTVDYNYEPMIMDFVCEENINLLPKSITNPEISDLMMGLNGSSPDSIKSMIKYLQDKYNPTFFECDKEYYMAFEDSFTLRSTMDSVPESYNLSHAMFCVEKIDENTYIVSNQGEKFIMEDNSGLIYNVGLKTT